MCPGSGGWGKPGDAEAQRAGLPDVQLFDLSSDVAETKNVAADHPEIVERLRKELEDGIARGRTTPGAQQSNDAEIVIMKSNKAKRATE
jgi:hypothetical protein